MLCLPLLVSMFILFLQEVATWFFPRTKTKTCPDRERMSLCLLFCWWHIRCKHARFVHSFMCCVLELTSGSKKKKKNESKIGDKVQTRPHWPPISDAFERTRPLGHRRDDGADLSKREPQENHPNCCISIVVEKKGSLVSSPWVGDLYPCNNENVHAWPRLEKHLRSMEQMPVGMQFKRFVFFCLVRVRMW